MVNINMTEERKREIINAILASEDFRHNMVLKKELATLYDGESTTVDMVLNVMFSRKAAGNLNFFSISCSVYFLLTVVQELATRRHAMRVAEILEWDELAQGQDRSYRIMIPKILKRIGDQSVVPALENFSVKVRGIIYHDYYNFGESLYYPAAEYNEMDQECIAQAIRVCREIV